MKKVIQINPVKIGTTVNVSIDNHLHKKSFPTNQEAIDFYKLLLEVKKNPTKENLAKVYGTLDLKVRKALECGLEVDTVTGNVYLAGFNTPIPELLVDVIKEYHENEFPKDAIINFWKLLMLNPDKRVREDLFKFIQTHDFVLTDNGYMVVYKAVYLNANSVSKKYVDAVNEYHDKVKYKWGTSIKRYVLYRDLEDDEYLITKKQTAENWNAHEMNIEIIGNLADIYGKLDDKKIVDGQVYTDMHSKSMEIVLGQPVLMERKECDGDPRNECSYGLHVGATKYVESFANRTSEVLVCLVNPANVVAVPSYDSSKIRVSEYFPIATAKYEDRKIEIIEEKYYENDYKTFEIEEIDSMVKRVKNEEKHLESAKKTDEDLRSSDEILSILASRIVDLNK